ncbi:MAG: hypothetical protein MRZ79_06360 [Bacteroidia bacterium]|nr:hypothetical protein [Bacteroidia bacterium]
MDFFTVLWILFTGGLGMYIGVDSLFRGEITLSAAQGWRMAACRKPSLLFYALSLIFILSGMALIFFTLYRIFPYAIYI